MAEPLKLNELLTELANVTGVVENPQVCFEDHNGDLHFVDCVTTIETESGTVIVLANNG